MISVIIPVLNESERIGSVIAFALRCPLVTEVIVADFVKAGFSRRAGRVTTLTARPLLKTFFPGAAGSVP